MNLLLDTHILLWWLDDSPELLPSAIEAIASGDNPAFVSAATIWEIVIKRALGKLDVPDDFQEVLEQQPFRHLEITSAHAFQVGSLPMFHRDPFDRLLVAQCQIEGLTLITRDPDIKRYDVSILQA